MSLDDIHHRNAQELNDAYQASNERKPTPFKASPDVVDNISNATSYSDSSQSHPVRPPFIHWYTGWEGKKYSESSSQELLDDIINDEYWNSNKPDPISGDMIAGYDEDGLLIQMKVVVPTNRPNTQHDIG